MIPLAVFFLCCAIVHLWRRHWNSAGLYFCVTVICILYYALCAQMAINRVYQRRLQEQASRITELIRKQAETGNRTSGPTVRANARP